MASVNVKKKRKLNLAQRDSIWAYILISPWLIGFVIFTLTPMIASLGLSFSKYDIVNPVSFVGLSNWTEMFIRDADFWHSLKITLTYAVIALPSGLAIGLALALLLNAKVPGLPVWRTLYYMPSVISGVAVSVLWQYVFNSRFGIANWILSWFGIRGPAWLNSTTWALPALIIMSLWSVGGSMITYLAGLQGIPTAYYEAATIDGATKWQQFWRITLPLVTPVIFYNLVTGMIGTFQIFTPAYIMTNRGGPAKATLFYNLQLYLNAYNYRRMGYASAMAWFLMFVVLGLTLLIFKSSQAWVYYEGELRG